MSTNIEMLEEYHKKILLKEYVNNDVHTYPGNVTELNTIKGTLLLINMYHNDDTASCRAFLSKDTELNWHIHEQKEFLIVYKGILEVDIEPDMLCEICIGKNKIDGNKIILGVGDCICLQPNVEHKVYSPEDTWVYSITIPADPSYPI